MSEQGPDPDADVDDGTIDVRRAWKRPGSQQSTGEDDSVLPLDDFHLHRYCAVFGFKPDDDPEYLSPEEWAELTGKQRSGDAEEEIANRVKFLSGYSRLGLRHTPAVILFTTLILFGSAEILDNIEGISVFLPTLTAIEWIGIVGGVVLYAALMLMILNVGLIDREELYKGAVVYGLITFLSIGVLLSVYLVFRYVSFNANPVVILEGGEAMTGGDEVPNNIVFVSGYLLMLLIGGLLVYDGLLRTEYLVENLEDTGIVGASDRYHEWKTSVRNQLSHTIGDSLNPFHDRLPIKTVYVFSTLFLTQYAVYWTIGKGPQNLDFALTTIANLLLNLFLVVVGFQFVILIAAFYRLLNEDREERFTFRDDSDTSEDTRVEERILRYKPYHSDGHAGYRDIGKFVTRVNLLLIMAGFYLVYRLFFQGSRVTPSELVPNFLHELIGIGIWFQSFLAPVFLYGLVACGWIYYTFWQIHLRMLRERERYYLCDTDDFESLEGWEIREQAPVWPVNNGLLWSLISGTFGPVIIYMVEFM